MSTIGRSWETAETKLLINLRQDMNREFTSMKRNAPLWKKISEHMNSIGYHRTDKQCKEKWKNLLSEFKRTDVLKESDRRAFPYYDLLKEIISRQGSFVESPSQLEETVNASYPPSPTPVSRVTIEHGPTMATRLPHVTLPPPVGYSPMSRYSPSIPASSNRITKQPDTHTSTSVYKPPTREPIDYEIIPTHANKRKRESGDDDKPHTILLTEIVELLRREIDERRRWEERLELSRIQSERRKERQERRRERRERERQERQRAQTLLLVAIASRVMPNVTDLIQSVNFHDVTTGSDSERSDGGGGGGASNSKYNE